MILTETIFEGCYVLEPSVFKDERGLFFELYQKEVFQKTIGRKVQFVQDNVSVSKKGVLRGLHFQKGSHSQAKLVTVLEGEVLDVVVDLRKGSKTFGNSFKQKLSSVNRKSIFIPKGMAHGFLTLSDNTIFSYKCDSIYNPKSESGILFNDPNLNIDWELPINELILSEKDLKLPMLKDLHL